MRITDTDQQLHFEGRTIPQRAWLTWGAAFLPGMLALLLLPESSRFIGFLIWIALWLGMLFFLPRWLGDTVRVTLDTQKREIVWLKNDAVSRRLKFSEVKEFDVQPLTIASRPYKAFQLVVLLRNGNRITLAVDPRETEIRRALMLARAKLR